MKSMYPPAMKYTLPAVVLLGVLFYLSWIPNPEIRNVGWIPGWVSEWADRRVIMRTGVGMFPLGFLAGVWIGVNRYDVYVFMMTGVALVGVVLLMELGQIFLPQRVFDLRDVFLGGMGGAGGMIFGLAVNRACGGLLRKRPRRRNYQKW